jgi:hypothetical protein
MAFDHGLHRFGAGVRGALADQGGDRAQRKARRIPGRTQKGRARQAVADMIVKGVKMMLLVRFHALKLAGDAGL